MLYRCDECKEIRNYPVGMVGLCACGASPACWIPARVSGTGDAAAPAASPARRETLHYRLSDGVQASVTGIDTPAQLLSDLVEKYGSRLVRVSSGTEVLLNRDGFF